MALPLLPTMLGTLPSFTLMGSPGTLSNIMGRVLTIQIVHRNPRCKPCSQARRKCTFGESIWRPYISNFNRAPIMILTSAPAAVAVAAMGMLVFSITGKSKSKSNMVANVSMSHMELLTQSKIRHILVQLQTVAS